MIELGEASLYLGAKIVRDDIRICLHQQSHIQTFLNRFDIAHCNSMNTLMCSSTKLQENTWTNEIDLKQFQSLIGALLYPATISRANISYAIGCLSRFLQRPQHTHLIAVKRVLRYLKGTANYGQYFPSNGYIQLVSYADADYGQCLDTRQSISGILHKLGDTIIEWSRKRQSTVALSRTEAWIQSTHRSHERCDPPLPTAPRTSPLQTEAKLYLQW